MTQVKDNADVNEPSPDAIEESVYRFYNHIWTLLQQNQFFITNGFYVFPGGGRRGLSMS